MQVWSASVAPRAAVSAAGAVRVLIVDPDPGALRFLRASMSAEPGVQIVGEAFTGSEALELARHTDPDLVVLNADLPDVNGIEVARRFARGIHPAVMFVAENDRHAADAFAVDALDYIVKPITPRRLRAAIERMRQRRGLSPRVVPAIGPASSGAEPRATARTGGFGSRMWMHSRGQVHVVDVDDIEWIGSDLRYSWVHLRNGESRRVREPISRIERRLDPARFARVHRSVIVNLASVAEAVSSAKTKAVILKSGRRLPMSRSRKSNIFLRSCD